MKKLLLTGALVTAGAFALQNVSIGHGGTYRGPGDTVPPAGGGGGAGGAAPTTPGPAGPSGPGSGPATGGAAQPGMPGAAPGGPAGPTTGAGGASGGDLEVWQFWWGFNKEPYLNLKDAIHSGGPLTGSDDFFIGRGESTSAQDLLRPSEEKIRQTIVPALIEALGSERQNDIVTGCLIALAKIGDAKDEQGDSQFEQTIKKFLSDGTQEIAETAAVSLGILANEASIPTLTALVMNTGPQSQAGTGQNLVNSTEVNYRTRAFAAYGLGLIGSRSQNNDNRKEIVKTLIESIETTKMATRDLHVAALISIGLVPVDPGEAPTAAEGEELVKDPAYFASTRQTQIEYLLEFFTDENEHFLERAQAPRSMARLLEPWQGSGEPLKDSALRERVATTLLDAAGKRTKEKDEVVQSAVLAMGQIADLDDDKIDQDMRSNLIEQITSSGNQQVNRFALISLAQLCAREGSGENAQKNYEAIASNLTRSLGKSGGGMSRLKPWLGLALGVMQRARTDANLATSKEVGQALRAALADCKVPADLGAYCIGAGISKDIEAKPIIVGKLADFADDEARGYAAVSLGLMGANDQIANIQSIVKESKYRPDLLKQAAIALGLLGDKNLVPDLIVMLGDAKSLSTQAALSSALGFIGDSRSIDPLVEMLQNKEITASARGFAAVALGIVADKEDLPWNSKISTDINYRANTTTLTGELGTGILDIL